MSLYVKLALLICVQLFLLSFQETESKHHSRNNRNDNGRGHGNKGNRDYNNDDGFQSNPNSHSNSNKKGRQAVKEPGDGQHNSTSSGNKNSTGGGNQGGGTGGQKGGGGNGRQGDGGSMDDENMVTEEPLLIYATAVPETEQPGFQYLGQIDGTRFYLSDDEATKDEAVKRCNELGQGQGTYGLAPLIRGRDFRFVSEMLESTCDDDSGTYWVNIVLENKDGKEYMTADGIFGREQYALDEGNTIDTVRRKRETPLVSHIERRLKRQRGGGGFGASLGASIGGGGGGGVFGASIGANIGGGGGGGGGGDDGGGFGASMGASIGGDGGDGDSGGGFQDDSGGQDGSGGQSLSGRKDGGGGGGQGGGGGHAVGQHDGAGALITLIDTKYPWLNNWTNSTGVCPSKCKPTVCTVSTPECTAETIGCMVRNKAACNISNGGNCSMVCENCKIEKPTCFVKEPKCVIIKERKCTVSNPLCGVVPGNCTLEREPCVTRQPPCNRTENQAQECTLPEPCLTHQGVECKDEERECGPDEQPTNGGLCTFKKCTPLDICMLPEYCRYDQIICPPVETFCPPEKLRCDPPIVSCEEPKIDCTEAEIHCPPPTVVCTKPQVNCSAPAVSCPNVITQCPNPDIECPPPKVCCPEPTVTCIPPPNPCPVSGSAKPIEDCEARCEKDCECVKLEKGSGGDGYRKSVTQCKERMKFICEGTELRSDDDGGGGGGGAGQGGGGQAAGDQGEGGHKKGGHESEPKGGGDSQPQEKSSGGGGEKKKKKGGRVGKKKDFKTAG